MKAFLLAAGLGTRLRPLTNSTPKCLIPISDKPLLAWWLELFSRHGVDKVLINTHHLPMKVRAFISEYSRSNSGISIYEFYEPTLLGSGGTVGANRDFIGDDESFLICYADNLTDINLTGLVDYHHSNDALLTMALFRANAPSQCGIAALDNQGRIVDFIEKPKNPSSNLANAGVYVADRNIFEYLPTSGFSDFGKDVLPQLIGRMYGYEISEYLIDVGTIENLEKARIDWRNDNI